jgi:hypothetical protein
MSRDPRTNARLFAKSARNCQPTSKRALEAGVDIWIDGPSVLNYCRSKQLLTLEKLTVWKSSV